jgi:Tfp pilus assembly major pilin PilA
MKIKAIRSYTSKNGNKVFVYAVSGTKEQLEKFKAAQGENYRQAEDGTPLWFTTRSVGAQGELIITTNGKVVPDMSAFDNAASLAKQYGGNLGEELAKAAVAKLLGANPDSVP